VNLIQRVIILCLTLVLASCGNQANQGDSSSTSNTQVTIAFGSAVATGALQGAGVIPSNIKSVTVQVIDAKGTVLMPPTTRAVNQSMVFNVSNGKGVVFRVLAFAGVNGTGKKLYEGESVANLNGVPITLSIIMSLAIDVSASATSIPRNGTTKLSALLGGVTPTAASPVLWSSPSGTLTGNVWTAPATLGTYTITAKVDPAINANQSSTMIGTIQIIVVNQAPSVNTLGAISIGRGSSNTALLTATDKDGDTVSFSLGVNTPSWVSLQGNTLTMAPDIAIALLTYNIDIIPTDALGLVGAATAQSITITNSRWGQFNWGAGTWN